MVPADSNRDPNPIVRFGHLIRRRWRRLRTGPRVEARPLLGGRGRDASGMCRAEQFHLRALSPCSRRGQVLKRPFHCPKKRGVGGDGEIVEHLARHDIPVCAHLGLKPQSVHKIGGFKVQGRDPDIARKMVDSARRLQDVGADIVLLECVPNELGAAVTEALDVPVIGIGAGPGVDGQILVLYDILDITPGQPVRYAERQPDRGFQPGSVGRIIARLVLPQALGKAAAR